MTEKDKALQKTIEEYEDYKKRAQHLVTQQNSELEELRKIQVDDKKLKKDLAELQIKYEEMVKVQSKNEQKLKSFHKLEEDVRTLETTKEELLEKLQRSDTVWAAQVHAVQMKIDAEKEEHILSKIVLKR